MKKIFINGAMWGLVGISLLVLDIFTKWAAVNYLVTPKVIIPGFLEFAVQFNPGISFSIPIPNTIMMILTPILLGIVIWILFKTLDMDKSLSKIGLILIITGGTGNLIDRIISGAVIDMIAFSFWPTFNLADSYLTIGTFLILIFYGKISLSEYGTKSNKNRPK